ncbi:hypothetical protein U27_01434 [Candidatus Vecturithrix granuli]|uniref:Uncharacterized protein n=1 Tax=Vecturithrix granuli TaxID=1499967 RepID=A0A081CAC8_VECG1|nr:hypothetical protein U27_01434 [Candidatus Vecturithrix granuli]
MNQRENPNKTLEGIKTRYATDATPIKEGEVKTLIKPWKGLKHFMDGNCDLYCQRENPNKTLEGIKTKASLLRLGSRFLVKTLIKPWKGLKLLKEGSCMAKNQVVKTLIKPWKGLKRIVDLNQLDMMWTCENPNKTLEGIKTLTYLRGRV